MKTCPSDLLSGDAMERALDTLSGGGGGRSPKRAQGEPEKAAHGKTYAKRKKTRQKATQTRKTDIFTALVESDLGERCEMEYKFHPTRKWRFDYAFPFLRVAVEIDGGVWTYGRHNRASGYINDMAKFNEAAAMGWTVLKFTPDEKFTAAALETIGRALEARRNEKQTETDNTTQTLKNNKT